MWIYRKTRDSEYEVGYYKPDGQFVTVGTVIDEIQAQTQVHYLNGGD